MTRQGVAVIGLGLIGGSIARELSARGARVLGHDLDPGSLQDAERAGAIEGALDERFTQLAQLDTLVLALPVSATVALLERVRPHLPSHMLVIDVASTKRSIVAAAERIGIERNFVGTHPLAGDHRGGWSAARAGLFAGAPVFLCPATGTHPRALLRARSFWQGLGAVPQVLAPAAHDRLMARVSHLPQLTASALARVLAGEGLTADALGPGGRDTLRLAASPPGIWTDVALDNADELLHLLPRLRAELARLESALQAQDTDAVRAFFQRATDWMQ